MSTAATIRATTRSISSTGVCSPSSQPSDRATAALDVATARQPGTAANARALATSHAFGSTSIGPRCIARSSSARDTSALPVCGDEQHDRRGTGDEQYGEVDEQRVAEET